MKTERMRCFMKYIELLIKIMSFFLFSFASAIASNSPISNKNTDFFSLVNVRCGCEDDNKTEKIDENWTEILEMTDIPDDSSLPDDFIILSK